MSHPEDLGPTGFLTRTVGAPRPPARLPRWGLITAMTGTCLLVSMLGHGDQTGADGAAAAPAVPATVIELPVAPGIADGVWWSGPTIVVGIALLFCVLLFMLIRAQHKYLIGLSRHRELESLVRERTTELAARHNEIAALHERLRDASLTDPLTGLHNRRYVHEIMDKLKAQVDRVHTSGNTDETEALYFVMIDLDGFKHINEAHGHAAGDRTLQQVAQVLLAVCREVDTVARWGGDEFLMVGRVSHPDMLDDVIERVRSAIAEHRFEVGDDQFETLTSSIGAAVYPFSARQPGLYSWEQVQDIADQAAYLAKISGKDAWIRVFERRQHRELPVDHVRLKLPELVTERYVNVVASRKLNFFKND